MIDANLKFMVKTAQNGFEMGPFTISEISAKRHSKAFADDYLVKELGGSEWFSLASLLARHAQTEAPKPAPAPDPTAAQVKAPEPVQALSKSQMRPVASAFCFDRKARITAVGGAILGFIIGVAVCGRYSVHYDGNGMAIRFDRLTGHTQCLDPYSGKILRP